MSTGYFGVPGEIGGKVHYVLHGKPICGCSLPRYSEFQWCASGFAENMIECRRCKAAYRKMMERKQ